MDGTSLDVTVLPSRTNLLRVLRDGGKTALVKSYRGARSAVRARNEWRAKEMYGRHLGLSMTTETRGLAETTDAGADPQARFAFLDGLPLGKALAGDARLALSPRECSRAFVVALQTLWELDADECGYYAFVSDYAAHYGSWQAFLEKDLPRLRAQLEASNIQAGSAFFTDVLSALNALHSQAQHLAAPMKFCVCHGDPIFDNAILLPSSQQAVLIDLEYATGALPAWDLGRWLVNSMLHYATVLTHVKQCVGDAAADLRIDHRDLRWYAEFYLCELATRDLMGRDLFGDFFREIAI